MVKNVSFLRIVHHLEDGPAKESSLYLAELLLADMDRDINRLTDTEDFGNVRDIWVSLCSNFGFYFGNYLFYKNHSRGEHSLLWQGVTNIDALVGLWNDNHKNEPSELVPRLADFIYPGQTVHSIGQYAYGRAHFTTASPFDEQAYLREIIGHIEDAMESFEDFYENEGSNPANSILDQFGKLYHDVIRYMESKS